MHHYANIADAAAAERYLQQKLAAHLKAAKAKENRLREEIKQARQAIDAATAGLDLEQVRIAEWVLAVWGNYERAGGDAGSVVRDAIIEIATGEKQGLAGLWREVCGVKNYAQWTGQRSDHAYGFSPTHGSITFAVGLQYHIRQRDPQQLSEKERIACVYYLENLAAIQAAKESRAA